LPYFLYREISVRTEINENILIIKQFINTAFIFEPGLFRFLLSKTIRYSISGIMIDDMKINIFPGLSKT